MEKTKMAGLLPVRGLAIILYLFGLLAFFGSLFMWGEGFFFAFPAGVDYAFPVADLLVHVPLAFIAATGLWRLRRYGYIASQLVAGFYLYASVEIFVRVAQAGPPYAIEIVAPQILAVLVAFGLIFYLGRVQALFYSR